MLRVRLLIIALLIGLVAGVMASARDVTPESDNECYTGGLWQDQCVTEWHWVCGWYIRNWRTTGATIPDWCGYPTGTTGIVPTVPTIAPVGPTPQPPQYPSAGCVYIGDPYGEYNDYKGGWSLAKYAETYSDAACQTPGTGIWSFPIVYAPSPFIAEDLCQEAFGRPVGQPIVPGGDQYFCF